MGSRSDEVEDIRREIDETRESLGTGVGALAYKADVKNRGKEAIDDKKEVVMEKVDELKQKVPGVGDGSGGDDGPGIGAKVKDKLPDPGAMKDKLPDGAPSKEDVKAKAQDAAQAAKDNPVAVVAGAAAAGLAAGLAMPETEIEREKLKPHAQEARQQAETKVKETVGQVKSGVQDAVDSTADAVREQAQQQGGKVGEVAEKAADKTQDKVSG
jgi:uncharacterized protein YjbJ (UPF0337 family)